MPPAISVPPGLRHDHTGRDLERARLLGQIASGHIPRTDATSASRELLASAEVLGDPTTTTCPLCRRSTVIHTRWVHGQTLKERSGTARSAGEITAMLRELAEVDKAELAEVDKAAERTTDKTTDPAEPDRAAEVARVADTAEIEVHTVEVCPRCGWNFLIATDTWRR